MSAPELCTDCGSYHHRWQAHVFQARVNAPVATTETNVVETTRTSDRKKSLAKKVWNEARTVTTLPIDRSQKCLECERMAREIDDLKAEIKALCKTRESNAESNESNEKANFDKKAYQREYMRKRRAKLSA